jgi:heat shock protein HslJ
MSFDNGTLRASAGCNSIGGTYTIANSVLNGGENFSSTMMGCDPDLMTQDAWLAGFLGAAPALSLDGDVLTMTAKGATLTLGPSAATPSRPLVGTTWTLETMTEREAASSVPADVEAPTLRIDADGQAAVTTGCNTGGAAVVVNDASLTFGPMRLTKVACKGEPQAVETAVLAVLDGDVTFAIEGAQLTLTKATQGLVYRAA